MKKKFLAVFTFMMLLIFASAFVACTDYTKPEDEKEDEKTKVSYEQVLKNGTFYDVSSTNKDDVYDSITNWTVSTAGLSAPSGGSNLSTGVFAGALDLTASGLTNILNSYSIDKSEVEFNEDGSEKSLAEPIAFANPGVDPKTPQTDKKDDDGNVIEGQKVNQDNNAFLLASKKTSGSIYLKSGTVTLEKNSVYRFSFSVCSKIENQASGAFVFIRGDMEKEYLAINTGNDWETYTFYIETNRTADMSVTVELWLGYGPVKSTSSTGNDKYATRGFAMFDNVIFTKLVGEVKNEQTEALFATDYENYDANETIHNNFLGFAENRDDVYSAYYLKDADLANRSHMTSTSYFTESSGNRKYFYEFRDYTSSNTSSSYWSKMSDFTAGSEYYGIVDPAKLFKADKTVNYANMSGKFMTYDNWNDKVMADAFKNRPETYVLMIYNNTLGASGFTTADANSVLIDANKCYEISVWAYVWTTEYEKEKTYLGDQAGADFKSILPAYSGSVKKPAEKVDPLGTTNTYTAAEKNVYRAFRKYSEENSSSVLKTAEIDGAQTDINYFEELNADEKAELGTFGASDINSFIASFKNRTLPAPDADKKYYDQIIIAIREWLRSATMNNTFGLSADDVKDTDTVTPEAFLYTYLYYSFLGAGSIVTSPAYNQATLIDLGFTSDFLRKAYLYERTQNLATMKKMADAVQKYEADLDQYNKDLDEYNKAVDLYKTECETWLNTNKKTINNEDVSIPHATFRVSGAGEEFDAVTAGINGWEKLTLYIRGNQLSSRSVSLSLIFGENDTATKKMIGGVFFDNVEIKEVEYNNTVAWHTLSELSSEKDISFGGMVSAIDPVTEESVMPDVADWKAEKAADTAEGDNTKINVYAEEDDSLQTIVIKDVGSYDSYKLVYEHTEATASSLVYDVSDVNKLVKILPNKYYRFAFQVKTVDVDGGVNITLLKKQDGDKEFSDFSTAVSGYVSEDWTEVVYYIRGAKDSVWYLSLEFAMNHGTRWDTYSFVQGKTELASFNCIEITKSEYDSHKTGDKIVDSLSLDNVTYDVDGGKIKNASYSSVDYANIKDRDYDENGIKENSIVPVQSWTAGTVYHNSFDAPVVTRENDTIKWDRPTGYGSDGQRINDTEAIVYEIWGKYSDDNNKEKTVLLAKMDATTELHNHFDLDSLAGYATWRDCSVSVKAVSENAVSALSSVVTISNGGTTVPTEIEGEKTVRTGARKVKDSDYAGSDYVSAYDYLYTIESDYQAAVAVTSTSASLSANSFYKFSVWVKTGADAKASIALTGTGGSVEANLTTDGVIGYSNISTDGKWEEYVIYVKTGNFTVSPAINLCLGNPYGKSHKVDLNEADGKTYYVADDLVKGAVYFDVVRVTEIKEEEYNTAEERIADNNGLLKEEDKLLYKNTTTHAYSIRYTIDSFDSSEKPSKDADKYGNKPNNYTQSNGDNVETADATYTNMAYGIYDANVDASDEDMYSALSYLYGNGEDKLVFNKVFGFAKDFTDAEWREFLKEFTALYNDELLKAGGNNVMILSNKLASGIAQIYKLDSSYKVSIAGGSYYKLTFAANTLLARPKFDKVIVPKEDQTAWSTKKSNYYVKSGSKYIIPTADYNQSTDYYQVSYVYDDSFAELRFASGEKDATDLKMSISSYNKVKNDDGTETETLYGNKTYTLYIYNPSSSAKDASWNFYLGDGNSIKDNAYNKLYVGMMAVDLISMEKIDENAYKAGIEGKYDAEGKLIDERSNVLRYEYAEDEKTENKDDEGEKDTETTPEEKKDFWKRLIEDDYFWLYISSVVLAVVIIIVVIVVLVRTYKKKHPKKVVGENNVKTIKDFKDVVEPEAQEKEEALEADEYVDEIKRPVVQQRVLPKKNKKKKK